MKTAITATLLLVVALSIPAGTAEACGGYVVPGDTPVREGPIVVLTGTVAPNLDAHYTVTLGPAEDLLLELRSSNGAQVHVAYQMATGPGIPVVATCGALVGADSSTTLTDSSPPRLALVNPSPAPTTYIVSITYLQGMSTPPSMVAPYVVEGAIAVGG